MFLLLIFNFDYFNSQPHEEADCNSLCKAANIELISTHSLTRRLTIAGVPKKTGAKDFNSQPHEEADDFRDKFCLSVYYFNSQPHEEADSNVRINADEVVAFQLTASRGG